MIYRRFEHGDIPYIRHIEMAEFPELADFGYQEWLALDGDTYDQGCYVLEHEGEVVGFHTYVLSGYTVWIHRFAIAKKFQKLGFGAYMLEQLMEKMMGDFGCYHIGVALIGNYEWFLQFGFMESVSPNGIPCIVRSE